jgi:hypothetical protein
VATAHGPFSGRPLSHVTAKIRNRPHHKGKIVKPKAKYVIDLPNGETIRRPVGKLVKTHALVCELPGPEYTASLFGSEDSARKDAMRVFNEKWQPSVRHIIALRIE